MIEDIKEMIKDLNNHKRPKDTLLDHFISYRLNKSIQSYYDQLSNSVDNIVFSPSIDKAIIKLSKEDI